MRRRAARTGLKLAGDFAAADLAAGGLTAEIASSKRRRKRRHMPDALGLLFGPTEFAAPDDVQELALRDSTDLVLRKFDDELQVVWAEVYLPDLLDTQEDFATEDEVRKFAWAHCAAGLSQQVDVNHDGDVLTPRAAMVETFIARDGDPTFLPGAWVVAIQVADPTTWGKIKRGEINGFSLEARAKRTYVELEFEVPESVTGKTMEASGHSHEWVVRWGDDGSFLGGEALPAVDPADPSGAPHSHPISRGTVTDAAAGHSHRYSVSEALLGLER